MITQKELKDFVEYREKLKEKEAKFRLVKAKLNDMEVAFIRRLEAEEVVEKGSLIPKIKVSLGKAVVKWKSIVLKLKGETYIEKLLQEAKRESPEIKSLEIVRS